MDVFSSAFYSQNKFYLPEYPTITCEPFKQQNNKILLPQTQNLDMKEIPPTCTFHYLKEFQAIAGTENLFPIFIEFIEERCFICCKDCFIIYSIHDHQSYEKINLPELPTAFKTSQHSILYFGLQSGSIIIYNSQTKTNLANLEQFTFPVIQIEIISSNQILAMDQYGNLKYINFAFKRIMDKIVKVSVNTESIVENFRVKKREKIKNFMKSLPFGKSDPTVSENGVENEDAGQKYRNPQNPPIFAVFINQQHHHQNSQAPQNSPYYQIAYAHLQQIKILEISPQFKIVKEQLLFKTAQKIGVLQFGYGGFKNSNQKHIILAISTEYTITFFRGIDLETSMQFIKVAEIMHPQKCMIYSGKFISNNLLLYLTERGIEISNVNDSPELLHIVNFSYFGYVDFFNSEQEKSNINKVLIYRNMLKNITKKSKSQEAGQGIEKYDQNKGNSEYVCLEGKRISYGVVYSWKNYLDKISESISEDSLKEDQKESEQQKWSKCMKLGLMIYNDKITKLAEINEIIQKRNEQMRHFFEKIAITYLSFTLKQQETDKLIKIHVIDEVTDFLIRTESFNFLSTAIFTLLKSNNFLQTFLHSLRSYIQAGLIKSIGEELLQLIITRYLSSDVQAKKREENRQCLQILFMNFDFEVMERVQILTYCLNYQLFRSLIYICAEQKDYVTPLIKLCGIRMSKEHSVEKLEKLSDIIFWYLRECLIGHLNQFNDEKAYIGLLDQLITFIFIPSSLDMLLRTSPKLLMQSINMIFQAKIMQYIMQNQQMFKVKKNKYIQEQKIFTDRCPQFQVYEKMLCTLIMTVKQLSHKDYQNQLLKFLTFLILKNTFPFSLKYKTQAFFYAVENPFIFVEEKTEKEKEQSVEKQVNFIILRILDSIMLDVSLEDNLKDKQKILYSIVDRLQYKQLTLEEQSIINTDKDIQTNKSILYKLQLIYAKSLILHELKKYADVIDNFFRSKCKIFIQQTYNYFGQILFKNYYRQRTNCSILLQYFMSHFPILLKHNLQKTLQISTEIPSEISYEDLGYQYFSQMMKKLEIYEKNEMPQKKMYLPLKFIEDILNSNPYIEENLKDKLLKEHLHIVVRDKLEELEFYILKMEYPLEEAFAICQQLNNKSALAYIHIKNGRNMQGVCMLTQIFLSKVKKAFSAIAKNSQTDSLPKISEQLTKILETCASEYINDSLKGEQLWQKIVDMIFKELNAKNVQKIGNIKIKEIVKEYIDRIITKMFSQVTADFFIDKYAQKLKNLPTYVFLKAFTLLFQRLQFTHIIKSLSKELLRKNELGGFSRVMRQARKGLSVQQQVQCSKCGIYILHLPSIICYNCHHYFHSKCLNETTRCLICEGNKFQRIKEAEFVDGQLRWRDKNDVQKYVKRLDSHRKQSFLERSQRLSQFDRNSELFYDDAYLEADP